MNLNFIDGL